MSTDSESETEKEYQRQKNAWRNRPIKYNAEADRDPLERWKRCPISGRSIKRPVLAGQWGHLLSPDGVIYYLQRYQQDALEAYDMQADHSPILDSLKALTNVVELKLQDNPELEVADALSSEEKEQMGDFVCPITGLETNGEHKFVFSWKCGCVIAKQALDDNGDLVEQKKCLFCEKPCDPFDYVLINPTTEKELTANQAADCIRSSLAPFFRGDKKFDRYRAWGSFNESHETVADEPIPEWARPFFKKPTSTSDACNSSSKRPFSPSSADQPSTSGLSKRTK